VIRGPERLGIGAAGLVVAAIAVLASGPQAGAPSGPGSAAAAFQRGVGGLGVGLAVHPERCGRAYDARVAPQCDWRHGAVPGADRFCPLHAPGSPAD